MTEVWRKVKEFAGKYEVSSCGRVRSLDYGRTGQTRILKPYKTRNGYLQVNLYKDGKKIHKSVHRLVAETFIENPLALPEVNHIDENKTNNAITNLEWCGHHYNVTFGTGIERHTKAIKGKFVNHPALSKKVLQYDLEGHLVKEWLSTMEVSRQTGWSQGSISDCCRGELKTSHGFVWRYASE